MNLVATEIHCLPSIEFVIFHAVDVAIDRYIEIYTDV